MRIKNISSTSLYKTSFFLLQNMVFLFSKVISNIQLTVLGVTKSVAFLLLFFYFEIH